jgi:hypothetical protein
MSPVLSSEMLGFPPDARARELVDAENIVLIDYRPLQQVWTRAL